MEPLPLGTRRSEGGDPFGPCIKGLQGNFGLVDQMRVWAICLSDCVALPLRQADPQMDQGIRGAVGFLSRRFQRLKEFEIVGYQGTVFLCRLIRIGAANFA